jgi:hypothetical protein
VATYHGTVVFVMPPYSTVMVLTEISLPGGMTADECDDWGARIGTSGRRANHRSIRWFPRVGFDGGCPVRHERACSVVSP